MLSVVPPSGGSYFGAESFSVSPLRSSHRQNHRAKQRHVHVSAPKITTYQQNPGHATLTSLLHPPQLKTYPHTFAHTRPSSLSIPGCHFSRINPLAGDLKRTVLTVFDAHDAFPIFTLRLLRSGGTPNGEGMPPSLPPQPQVLRNTGGNATEDWTIVSGGGDGAVAHWSVVGLASPNEVAAGAEEAGVELHKIGDYEVR